MAIIFGKQAITEAGQRLLLGVLEIILELKLEQAPYSSRTSALIKLIILDLEYALLTHLQGCSGPGGNLSVHTWVLVPHGKGDVR